MPIMSKGWNAERLEPYSQQLIRGLIQRKIKVVSYACDGTESERLIQALLAKHADERKKISVPMPEGEQPLTLDILFFDNQAVVMIQDSKHALKTLRNNLFSGAKLLTFGNHCGFYAQLHAVAFQPGSPLYHRDVEKVDRQDDNAATRLFSAANLEFITKNHPEWTFTATYLFVFGELIDAYQSRSITHAERIGIVILAHIFLGRWTSFLDCAGYEKSRYFISRECADILRIIIHGYLSLVIVYRDYMPGNTTPLLPWLHSSEPCEHSFGNCRLQVKDFTYLDFLYMIPRLHISLRHAVIRSRTSDGKARASGYCHTYFDSRGSNALALMSLPTVEEIAVIAATARDRADSLSVSCGVDPKRLRQLGKLKARSKPLASISEWLPTAELNDDEVSDDDSIRAMEDDSDELCMLLDMVDSDSVRNKMTHTQILQAQQLSCAAAALMVENHRKVQMFSNPKPAEVEEDEEALASQVIELDKYLQSVRCVSVPSIGVAPSIFGSAGINITSPADFDFSQLVAIRRAHQTAQASTGVRTYDHSTQATGPSRTRIELTKQLYAVLKESGNDIGITTGVGREIRTQALGNSDAITVTKGGASGNSANYNAAFVAVARGGAVGLYCSMIFDADTEAVGTGFTPKILRESRYSAGFGADHRRGTYKSG
ncbi:hypothetical protein GGX14DRAFT_375908 [Mycena pura]|uniref:Uncharacterized protein n=1 Tax=Mycena pura TaxID=153505 RepID=A0AAD6Y2Z6_9AGAR|nr:hypothetical protein GGX14DRAFT_375908 [Mycena pura]